MSSLPTPASNVTFPRTHEAYLSLTEQARNQVAVARAVIAPLGGKAATPTPVQLQFALADGHEAIGKLMRASATLGDEIPAQWSVRASGSVTQAVSEIQRMLDGRTADTTFAVGCLDQAVHDIDRGRRLLISPPSTNVYDGS